MYNVYVQWPLSRTVTSWRHAGNNASPNLYLIVRLLNTNCCMYVCTYVHAVTNNCVAQFIVMSLHEPCSEYLSMVLVSILYI